jgi:hypothetical protein
LASTFSTSVSCEAANATDAFEPADGHSAAVSIVVPTTRYERPRVASAPSAPLAVRDSWKRSALCVT